MKQLLLGFLLVLLAAVVVTNRQWKRSTFLLMLVGIVFCIVLVGMVREGFQSGCADPGVTWVVEGGPTLFANFESILRSTGGTDIVRSGTTPYGDLTGLYGADRTAFPTKPNAATEGVEKYRYLGQLTYLLLNAQCYDRMIALFTWMMSTHSFLFPINYKSQRYTGDLSTVSLQHYVNFVYLFQDYCSALRSSDSVDSAAFISGLTAPGIDATNRDQRLSEVTSRFSLVFFRDLAIAYHILRPIISRTDPRNVYLYWFGLWLSRASIVANSIQGSRNQDGLFYIQRGLYFMYFNISPLTNYNAPFVIRQFAFITAGVQTLQHLVGTQSDAVPVLRDPSTPNNFSMTSSTAPMNLFYEFRIPGFIYHACNPSTNVIDMHQVYLGHIFFLLLTVRKTIGILNLNATGDALTNITNWYGTKNGPMKVTTTISFHRFIVDYVKPYLQDIVANVCADELIEERVATKSMTATQLDTLMRNYLGSTDCIGPISVQSLLDLIDTPRFPTDTVTTSIPTLGATVSDIAGAMRKVVFKTNLDRQNRTWLPATSQTAATNQMMPDVNTFTTDIPRLPHRKMLDYITSAVDTSTYGMDDSKLLPELNTYFSQLKMGSDISTNFANYSILKVPLNSYVNVLNHFSTTLPGTPKTNRTAYYESVNPGVDPMPSPSAAPVTAPVAAPIAAVRSPVTAPVAAPAPA